MLEFILGFIIGGGVGMFITAVCVAGKDKTAKDYVMIDKNNQI